MRHAPNRRRDEPRLALPCRKSLQGCARLPEAKESLGDKKKRAKQGCVVWQRGSGAWHFDRAAYHVVRDCTLRAQPGHEQKGHVTGGDVIANGDGFVGCWEKWLHQRD